MVDGALTTFLGGRWPIHHVPSPTGRTSVQAPQVVLTTFFEGQWTVDHIAAEEQRSRGSKRGGEGAAAG